VLQRGGRGVRRGRARRLRHSETLLLRQRRACRSASRRQDAARAGRSGCAGSTRTAPSVAGCRRGRGRTSSKCWLRGICGREAVRGHGRGRARRRWHAHLGGALRARRQRPTSHPSRASVNGRARRRGRRRVGLRKLWVTGSVLLSKAATGRRFPTAPPPQVMCAPVRPHGLPRGSACRRPGRAALRCGPRAGRSDEPPRPVAERGAGGSTRGRPAMQTPGGRRAGPGARSGHGRTVAVRCRLARAAPPSPSEPIAHAAGGGSGSHTRAPGHSSAVLLPSKGR